MVCRKETGVSIEFSLHHQIMSGGWLFGMQEGMLADPDAAAEGDGLDLALGAKKKKKKKKVRHICDNHRDSVDRQMWMHR